MLFLFSSTETLFGLDWNLLANKEARAVRILELDLGTRGEVFREDVLRYSSSLLISFNLWNLMFLLILTGIDWWLLGTSGMGSFVVTMMASRLRLSEISCSLSLAT